MKHFYIITNKNKDPDYRVTCAIRDYLTAHGRECSIQTESRGSDGTRGYTDASVVQQDVDCIIVLGGDGTLLQAATDLADKNVPFLGINLGTLGFLAEVNQEDIERAMEQLLQGEFAIENRMMLVGRSYGEAKEEKDNTRALNDIVITRKGSLQIINFSISVNGQFLHRYHADGMIVATPTGSTGYNLSAGGPVVDPKARLILITPICPHSMQHSSIVLSPEDEITVEIENGHDGARQEVEVIFDGSHRISLNTGDRVVIRESEKTTGIVKLNRVSFLEILHRKMND